MNKALSDKSFWDEYWKKERKSDDPTNYIFNDLFKKYLPNGGTYLEVGCATGTTMVNFHKTFNYSVTGVDYSQADIARKTLEIHEVPDAVVIDADFTTMPIHTQFDVVASYGLVEHFQNYEEIINKQAAFVKPGGYLVIELPNLRYANWLMYRIFDRELLENHNLNIMDPAVLSEAIQKSGNFNILFCNYYFTNFLFFDANNPVIADHPFIKRMLFAVRGIMKLLRLDNIPNKFFSPYLILIAQKNIA